MLTAYSSHVLEPIIKLLPEQQEVTCLDNVSFKQRNDVNMYLVQGVTQAAFMTNLYATVTNF